MSRRRVILLGDLGGVRGAIEDAVDEAGCEAVRIESWAEGRGALGADGPVAMVFPAGMAGFEELFVELRADATHGDLPLIAVTESAWDPALPRLFMFSIDDFVPGDDLPGLVPKLVALSKGDPYADLPSGLGRVVVADAERSRRVLYGRLFRRKGFDVDFAVDAADLARVARRGEAPRLVLAARDLPPDGALVTPAILHEAGEAAGAAPWIYVLGAREPEPAGETEGGGARFLGADDPPDNVLFLANELLSPPPKNLRASERLLYNAPATFLVAGRERPVASFTYNINRTGLYLRTTAPPPSGARVEIEVRPPFGRGRAAVEAQVVWRKEAGSKTGPVAPAGFGVVYSEVPLADGAALEAGYDELLRRAAEG